MARRLLNNTRLFLRVTFGFRKKMTIKGQRRKEAGSVTFSQKINALFLISGKKGRGEQGGGGEGQRVRQVQVGSAPAYFENFPAIF